MKPVKPKLVLPLILTTVMLFIFASCGGEDEQPPLALIPIEFPTPEPTATIQPTETLIPAPTTTLVPLPAAQPTKTPDPTPLPTSTPLPTATPEPKPITLMRPATADANQVKELALKALNQIRTSHGLTATRKNENDQTAQRVAEHAAANGWASLWDERGIDPHLHDVLSPGPALPESTLIIVHKAIEATQSVLWPEGMPLTDARWGGLHRNETEQFWARGGPDGNWWSTSVGYATAEDGTAYTVIRLFNERAILEINTNQQSPSLFAVLGNVKDAGPGARLSMTVTRRNAPSRQLTDEERSQTFGYDYGEVVWIAQGKNVASPRMRWASKCPSPFSLDWSADWQTPDTPSCSQGPALLQHGVLHPVRWQTVPAPSAGPPGSLGIYLEMALLGQDPPPGLYTVVVEYLDDENREPEVVAALPIIVDVLSPNLYRGRRNDSQVELQWDRPLELPDTEPYLWEIQWTRSWDNRPQTHNDEVTWNSHEAKETGVRTITGLRRTWDYQMRVRGKTTGNYPLGWSDWLKVPRIDAISVSDGPATPPETVLTWTSYAKTKDAVMETINASRRNRGLGELQRMADDSSQGHAEDMAVECYLSIWNTDGTKPHTRQALSSNYHWTQQIVYGHGWCPEAELAPEARPENPTEELTLAIRRRLDAALPTGKNEYADLVAPGEKPHAPKLRSAQPDQNAAFISWSHPTGPPASSWQYMVTKIGQEPNPNTWQTIPSHAAKQLSHRVEGLQADTKYAFRVRAINTAGPGNSSNVVTALITGQQKRGIRLKARMYGDGRLAIKWHDPVGNQEENLRYQYRYKPLGGTHSVWTNVFLSEENEVVVKHGLHPDTDYEVEMRAVAESRQLRSVYRIMLTAPNGTTTKWHDIPLNTSERNALAERAIQQYYAQDPNINRYELRINLPRSGYSTWTPLILNQNEHLLFQENRRIPGNYEASINPKNDANHLIMLHYPDGHKSSSKEIYMEQLRPSDYSPGERHDIQIRQVAEPTTNEQRTTLLSIEHAPEYMFELRVETSIEEPSAWRNFTLNQQEAEQFQQSRSTSKAYEVKLREASNTEHQAMLIFPNGTTSEWKNFRLDEPKPTKIDPEKRIRAQIKKAETQPYQIRIRIASRQYSEVKTIYLDENEESVVAQLALDITRGTLSEKAAYQHENQNTAVRGSNLARVKAGQPATPTGLRTKSDGDSITLEWENPNDYRVTGWEYRQRTLDGDWGNWTSAGSSSIPVNTPPLRRGRKYLFQVRALWNDRASQPSLAAERLHPAAPSLSPSLDTIQPASRPIINWKPAGREFVSGWEFQVEKQDGTKSAWTPIPGGANARTHVINGYWTDTNPMVWQPGIPAGHQYNIRVRATAGGLGGPPSQPVEHSARHDATSTEKLEFEKVSNTTSRQWQKALLNPQATHVSVGVAQNYVGQTWMSIDVSSRMLELNRAPEIVDGHLTVAGRIIDGRSNLDSDDIQVEIRWDIGPWHLEPSQLARTAGYDPGQPAGIILPGLVAYKDVDFVALPDPSIEDDSINPCVRQSRAEACVSYQRPYSPYEAIRDEPPRNAREALLLHQDAWQTYLRDNRLVPVYRARAQIWETQGRRFHIEANVRDMIEEYQDGTYTVVIALRDQQNSTWKIAASYPTFHGQEPVVPNQWGTGYRPDRTVSELASVSGQTLSGNVRNYQINAVKGWNELRLTQPQTAELIASQSWLRDWISLEEKNAAEALVLIAQAEANQRGNSGLLERLLDDLMLRNGVAPFDTTALRSIYAVAFIQGRYALTQEILDREGFREGLSENDVKSLTVLPSVTRGAEIGNQRSISLLEWYKTGLYLGQQKRPFDFQERVIRTSLGGEVTLSLFRIEKGSVQLMDTLADSVRTVERLMDKAMPVSYVAVLVHDDSTDQIEKHPAIGQHYGTHFTIHPNYDRAHWGGHDNAGLQVSGLVSRYYWTHREGDERNLIRDGANEVISYLAEQERSGRQLWPAYAPCPWAENISAISDIDISATQKDIEICQYALMSRLFLELMETTGPNQMLERLRRLSARLNNETTSGNAREELERIFPETHNLSVIHKWWEGRTRLGRGPNQQAATDIATLPNAYGQLLLSVSSGCTDSQATQPLGSTPQTGQATTAEEFDPRVCAEVEYRRRSASAQPIEVTMAFHYEDGHRYREETRIMNYARQAADIEASIWRVELPEAAIGNHWVQLFLKGDQVAIAPFYSAGPVDPDATQEELQTEKLP